MVWRERRRHIDATDNTMHSLGLWDRETFWILCKNKPSPEICDLKRTTHMCNARRVAFGVIEETNYLTSPNFRMHNKEIQTFFKIE